LERNAGINRYFKQLSTKRALDGFTDFHAAILNPRGKITMALIFKIRG